MRPPKTIASKHIYRGPYLQLREDLLDMGLEHPIRRVIVEFGQAVVIAPIDEQDQVLMVRQYRHPPARTLLELPAGGIAEGEEPQATAQRELREETGYAAQRLQPMGGFYSAPGFCDEYLHFFVARGLRKDPLPPDEDEHIELAPVPLDRVPDMIRSGEIRDAKSIAGLAILLWDR